MKNSILKFLGFFFMFFISFNLYAYETLLKGKIIDAKSKEALPGASIILVNTAFGAVSNVNGDYYLKNLPPGSYTIKVSYVGYKTKEIKININSQQTIEQNFELSPDFIEGQEVVITAQASGQKAAINQQLSADRIVNIVSAEKIQELPDANAAESVGRLPGVSILRHGGEGTSVVIRGLAPKFNQITIDGVQLASANPDNRSNDISMITPNILGSIQVSKTITSDMDANVFGGVVNFELKEAKMKKENELPISILFQGGYNNLSNAYNKFNNYKYLMNLENRFLDEKLGLMAQLNIERRNLTSNDINVGYDPVATNFIDYKIQNMNLSYNYRDIQRFNTAFVLDYALTNGLIKLTNFINYSNSSIIRRIDSYNIIGNYIDFLNSDLSSNSYDLTNYFELNQNLSFITLVAKITHSYAQSRAPNNWNVDFLQNSAGLSTLIDKINVDPEIVQKTAAINLSQAYMSGISTSNDYSKENNWSISLDFLKDFQVSNLIIGKLKFGALYRYQNKAFERDVYDGGGLQFGGAKFVDSLITNYFSLPNNLGYQIPIILFPDQNFDYGKFLGGQFKMLYPVNIGPFSNLFDYLKNNYDKILANNGWSAFVHDKYLSTTYDYKGKENRYAFYGMANIKIGTDLNFIFGIRYQNLTTNYNGMRGIQTRGSVLTYNYYDTTSVKSFGYWLPNFSFLYRPLNWLDLRFAYSNTLAYPDYQAIIPRINVGSGEINWNNLNLEPSRSVNFDFYITLHENTLGFLSFGAFLKNISRLIYPWSFYVSGAKAISYFPAKLLGETNPTGTYKINTFINNKNLIKDYGIEVDWQTHLWYLPSILSGVVLSVNYTHILSKASYPFTLIRFSGRKIVYVDTTFTDKLLYQPDDIINLSLGFDYRDFSIRIAMLYQADIFTGVNFWPQIRTNTASYRRWDIAFKQTLPWNNLELYGAINNINGASDKEILQLSRKLKSIEDYGATGYLGIRWNFK